MKAVSILKTYFGTLPGQTLSQFADEVRKLRDGNPEGYREVVTLAAAELGKEVEWE